MMWIQVLACLHQEFPDCIILQGLHITDSPAAKSFFSQWPGLRRAAEKAYEKDREIASTFHEASTQFAFMSISARQRDLEDALRRQSVDLQVIARRTEPLSPTRKHKVAPPLSPPSIPSHAHPSPTLAASISSSTSAAAPLLNSSSCIPSPSAVTSSSSLETIPEMLVPHPPHLSQCEQSSIHTPISVMMGAERFHCLCRHPPFVHHLFSSFRLLQHSITHPAHPAHPIPPRQHTLLLSLPLTLPTAPGKQSSR